MLPSELSAGSFSQYSAGAKQLAIERLSVMQHIPLALLPLLLQQIIQYEWLFPAEQRELIGQLDYLAAISPSQLEMILSPFTAIHIPKKISKTDWVNHPAQLSRQLTAFLWSTHQIDEYHRAAQLFLKKIRTAVVREYPEIPRHTMVAIGAGAADTSIEIFRRLKQHGVLFTQIDPTSGWQALLGALVARAQRRPRDHMHWYIDGGDPDVLIDTAPGINVVSYGRLAPAIRKELRLLNGNVKRPPHEEPTQVEATIAYMEGITVNDLELNGLADKSAVLQHFELDILTEGSGTQVYSTTFVQWAARECLRRARPLTLLARFRPRQQSATMNELLARDPFAQPTDPAGSLVDADMGAYYTWIDQDRLEGADQSSFLAWFEDHGTAIAVGPSMPKGTISDKPTNLTKLLEWMG